MKQASIFRTGRGALALLLTAVLAACGGGSGSEDAAQREAPQAVAAAAAPGSNGSWVKLAAVGASYTLNAQRLVRFGAGNQWAYKLSATGGTCNPTQFRSLWSLPPGTLPQCEIWVPSTDTDPWVKVADAGGNFILTLAARVRFGAEPKWSERSMISLVFCRASYFTGATAATGQSCQIYAGTAGYTPPPPPPPPATGMTVPDAKRLADQASFGASESLLAQMASVAPAAWVKAQMNLSASRYTSGQGDDIDRNVQETFFCDRAPYAGPNCWRDWFSTEPLVWDFYRNALTQPDQLRQRVAFALQQVVVVSGVEISGTYAMREYHNMLLDNAFTNWRQLLKKVTLSPVMGEYLNHVNNDRLAPNENFARELLQLFSVGTCELNADGTLKGGRCQPTYNNQLVRDYAYALTGWTYPAGGSTVWGCWPQGTNCTYRKGDMVAVQSLHDANPRTLLSGVTLAASRTPAQALERVLDSLMAHPSTAPFVARQLIQHLVGSNPSAAYVQRVGQAFASGRYAAADGTGFGTGTAGDLAATVAAVLLDSEARSTTRRPQDGKLREPALMMTGALRALNGRTDGQALGWWWGEVLNQHVFRSPSVFNFFSPSFPVPGTGLLGPEFGIHNVNAALDRFNFMTYLLDWGGSDPSADVPAAVGTKVDLASFQADAADAAKLVDRLSRVALGEPLPAAQRNQVINATQVWTAQNDSNWQSSRVRTAAWLIFGSPAWQVQR